MKLTTASLRYSYHFKIINLKEAKHVFVNYPHAVFIRSYKALYPVFIITLTVFRYRFCFITDNANVLKQRNFLNKLNKWNPNEDQLLFLHYNEACTDFTTSLIC